MLCYSIKFCSWHASHNAVHDGSGVVVIFFQAAEPDIVTTSGQLDFSGRPADVLLKYGDHAFIDSVDTGSRLLFPIQIVPDLKQGELGCPSVSERLPRRMI